MFCSTHIEFKVLFIITLHSRNIHSKNHIFLFDPIETNSSLVWFMHFIHTVDLDDIYIYENSNWAMKVEMSTFQKKKKK